jgi:hypothetical protein
MAPSIAARNLEHNLMNNNKIFQTSSSRGTTLRYNGQSYRPFAADSDHVNITTPAFDAEHFAIAAVDEALEQSTCACEILRDSNSQFALLKSI